ncbi:MAG: SpoIIE family protein phosphatase [Desulfobulbaceae bacterium]|nr:SpoIIE family protein phosphatase [Desulfobulbaceae bacterium]
MSKIDELKKILDVPVVISDRSGLVIYANQCFLETYRWSEKLIGSSLNQIIPTAYHDSHNMGFSRFLVTGKSRISDHMIEAAVIMGDGQRRWTRHLIVVEKVDGNFLIGAKLIPVEQAFAPSPSSSPCEGQMPLSPVIDELRETIGKMEVALSEIEDAIIWTDATGEVRWCNKAFDNLVGRSHLSILGSDLSELLPLKSPRNSVDSTEEPIQELLASDYNRREFEAELQGKLEILEISCSEFSLSDSQKSVILALRVVTQQRRMADALAASRKRMEEELQIGREIQMSLLPATLSEEAEFSLCAHCEPALEVGGDFYDHYFVRKNQLCFCVGDVSGKGVPAALFMAVAKTMLRDHAYGKKNQTAQIVRQVNSQMSAHNPASMFCSLFIGILDIKSGLLFYTNAGHNPPFFKENEGSYELIKDKHGPVLGVSDEVVYDEGSIQMEPGDSILVYTDGVTEAVGENDDFYTVDRFRNFLEGEKKVEPSVLVSAVAADVRRFKGKARQADDITLICLEYKGQKLEYQI